MEKKFRSGTDRAICPEETLEKARPHMAALGITRIANVTGLDRIGIPVVSVFRPLARSLVAAQGKGLTLCAAQVSGLMESIESHHAEHAELPLRLTSLAELRRSREVVSVAGLARPLGSKYHDEARLLWVEGYDIARDRAVWVPWEAVHLDYRSPLPPGSGCFFASSNGLASGNTPLEAITHGIWELVERDANALARLASPEEKRQRRVALDTIDDDACRSILKRFEEAGVRVMVTDVTTDVGIASYLCTVADSNPSRLRPLRPVSGSGCHPRREVALLRALTESAQGRLTLISGSRDDLSNTLYEPARALEGLKRFHEEWSHTEHARPFDATPTVDSPDFISDLELAVSSLARVGLSEVAVVDLSKPEIGIPVVRVIVPGLESLSESPHYLPGARARRAMEQAA